MNIDSYLLDSAVVDFYKTVARLDADDLVAGAFRDVFDNAMDGLPGPSDVQFLLNQLHATLAVLDEAWNDATPLPNEPW